MNQYKIKIKPHHYKIVQHFAKFADPHWYPEVEITTEAIYAVIKNETYGPKSLTTVEKELIVPFMNGKGNVELTIKMVWEEMADWWSNSWGWAGPMRANIYNEYKDRHITKNTTFIKILIKIYRTCLKDGFVESLIKFTGISNEAKLKYMNRKFYPDIIA